MISRTLARKASITGLDFGGGQFIVDHDRPQEFSLGNHCIFPLLEHIGKIIDGFGGRVILSPDLNTSVNNMHIVRRCTEHVIGNPGDDIFVPVESGREEQGVVNGSGDSADLAAFSVFQSLKQAFCFLDNDSDADLSGRKLLVIGLGKCGMSLIDYLIQEGADIYGADIDPSACRVMEEVYGVKILARDRQKMREIYKFPCDAILPCATGSLISDKRIAGFQTRVICGSASNQLNDDRDAVFLHERNILFVPDFIANCGGLLNVVQEVRISPEGPVYREKYDENDVKERVYRMQDVLKDILIYSGQEGLSPWELSLATAQSRLESQRKIRWIRYFNRKINGDNC
jgi:glutamate dehydrogenase/leucine dehydrogenase